MEIFDPGGQFSSAEARLAVLLARQFGVFSRQQAFECGYTDRMVRTRLGRGVWAVVHTGVYRVVAGPSTWEQRLMAACLSVGRGAVVSHGAAGALWKLDGCEPRRVELSLEGDGRRAAAGVTVHGTRFLPLADRGEVSGIPVTRVARTLIDLASVLDEEALEGALDSALREHLVSVGHLERRLERLGSRGRPGTPALRDLLADLRGGRPTESRREIRLSRLLVASGLPRPVRQCELRDGAAHVARFDLAYPDVRIGMEFDSYQHHFGRRAWRKDQGRHNRATALGWLVFHITEDDLAPASTAVVGIVAAYRQRQAA